MRQRPHVLLSCAMSIDGFIDDASDRRLVLSNDADLDRVDEVRASCDAILVGAGTIRTDDPRLLVRSPARRRDRVARGLPPSPAKVTLTSRGDLDPAARFFTAAAPADELDAFARAGGSSGPADELDAFARADGSSGSSRIVYVASAGAEIARGRLADVATVVDAGQQIDLSFVLANLVSRGIGRLMVEGGCSVYTQFLTAGLADELELAVAPFFVGDSGAPRFVRDGSFLWNRGHPARLAEVGRLGDVVLLRYALSGPQGSA